MNTRNLIKTKIAKQAARRRRVRAKIFGTATRPRLRVFKSNKHIWAQLIDDNAGKTMAAASDVSMGAPQTSKSGGGDAKMTAKRGLACEVGKKIARAAKDLKIEAAVFDRGGRKYHGRIKSLAEGARSEGLKF